MPTLRRCDGLKDCTNLSSLRLPNLVEVGSNGFEFCPSLTELNLPLLTKCEGFLGCLNLSILDLPNLEVVTYTGFCNCENLK